MTDDFKMPETIYLWEEGVWSSDPYDNELEGEKTEYTRSDLCVPKLDSIILLDELRKTCRFIDRLIMAGAWEPSEGDALLDKADKAITEYEQKHGEKK